MYIAYFLPQEVLRMQLIFLNLDLNVIFNGECDTHSYKSCIEAHTNTTVLPNGEYANDAFTADDEVCGNDGSTYQSIHHLQCHTRLDKCEFCVAREMERERLDAEEIAISKCIEVYGPIIKHIADKHLSKFSYFHKAPFIQ